MTREELLHELMTATGLSRTEASNFYSSLVDIATNKLKSEGEFTFPGFGVVKVTKREAREGRNPRTGEKLIIPERKGIKFKPYKGIKDAVNA